MYSAIMRNVSVFAIFSCSLLINAAYSYEWKTLYYKQLVDHFSFAVHDFFPQRYLINSTFWNKNGGPIFLYTGNEGDIEWFAKNTGFMWEAATEFDALLVFAEHRYYGQSQPYGNKSFSDLKYLGYLTSEQALADYAELISFIKSTIPGAADSPVVAFGGSYGGMLAAWMRLKYPHLVTGAIAASAPILQFTGLTPCDAFNRVVTADFTAADPECSKTIRKSWTALNKILLNGKCDTNGKEWLSSTWKLCKPINTTEDIDTLKDWLTNVWTNLAMVNYPYPASFLAPLPKFPVQAVCEHLTNSTLEDRALLIQIFQGLSVYTNFTGQTKCLDIGIQADQSLGDLGWDFQACSEMVMPMCSDNINDMFEFQPWSLPKYSSKCESKWGVTPRAMMAPLIYGGKNISSSSQIVFSNGLLDPWSTGGVTKSISDSIVAIIIPEGAHHLDLRASHPDDPQSVLKARKMEKQFIKKWIDAACMKKEMKQPIIL